MLNECRSEVDYLLATALEKCNVRLNHNHSGNKIRFKNFLGKQINSELKVEHNVVR